MDKLRQTLESDLVRLEPFEDRHVDGLKEACDADREIWDIYPANLSGDGFAAGLSLFRARPDWTGFAVIDPQANRVVGMTHYIAPTIFGVVEIGGTYIDPGARGTGLNRSMKQLLIDHAFESGFEKVEFRVDTRNGRSMAAVEKLGARKEGVIRQNMVTWTGYRRDTAVFGLLKSEWAG